MEKSEYLKKLEDPTYLPSREEVFQQCREWLCHVFMDHYERSKGKIEHEFVTQELVQWLMNHLENYLDQERVSLLEVCAGNGRLAYHMQKSLQEKYWDKFSYHAVDNWDQNRENKLPIVENIDNDQWLEKYNPDIILCSRLPLHPYDRLPKGFTDKFDELKYREHKNDQEEKELGEMYIVFWTVYNWNDITYYWRQNPNIKEYILIWKTSSNWDGEKTHWYKDGGHIPKYIHESHTKEVWERMYADKNALFRQDWFTKKELNIPTMNRINAMYGFKDTRDNSQIFSFKRDNKPKKSNITEHEETVFVRETIAEHRARYDKLYNILK